MRIRAFQGLVPAPGRAADVACVPYDVVDTAEAAALFRDLPDSLLRVDRAEAELPPGTDPHGDAVYARARDNFLRLQRAGALVRESEPCLYLYRQVLDGRAQHGLMALCHVDDYDAGLIKRHELTRRDKEDDRTRLVDTLSANTGPIFLAYRDSQDATALVREVAAGAPRDDFTAPDGVRHTVWRVPGGDAFVRAFASVPAFYIADGHHRAASAARVARLRRQSAGAAPADHDWFLCVLFAASELRILPYNRVVADLHGRSPEAFLAELARLGPVAPATSPHPAAPGVTCVFVAGAWHTFRLPPPAGAGPIDRLDASILQTRVLAPLLGIDDPRTSRRIDFVGGIRGTSELERRAGAAGCAFSMHPVTLDQLMEIADAGEIMPPKSTWFEPKLRSGLAIHTF